MSLLLLDQTPASGTQEGTELQFGDLIMDLSSQRVLINGQNVHFVRREFRLVTLLVLNAQRIVSRSTITRHMYGESVAIKSNVIDSIVSKSRKKLQNAGSKIKIQTFFGSGYCLTI